MPYIIDGVNLIGSGPDFSSDDPNAQSRLLVVLRKYQENKKSSVIVLLKDIQDIQTEERDFSSKFCVQCPATGATVEDEIGRILERFHNFKDVVVVTSDRNLKTLAKKKGARVVNSTEFYFELKRISRISGMEEESQKRIEARVSDREVDQWMKIFDQ
ncbi:MAG: NYN domain-containing protein [Candidatus Omnitrophota bacterium]